VRALATTPGTADSTCVVDLPDPRPGAEEVLLRTLEVGVCGTDREICRGRFGVPPVGEERLVLGHEFLGMVEQDGHGFSRGDLVTATVRRSCDSCGACEAGAPDACQTGRYRERGITRLHGYASELVAEATEHLIAVPAHLGRLGVLAEPASICARGLRHVRAIGQRQPWEPARALVLGRGAIGMLATYILRLADVDVWTAARSPRGSDKERLISACGARYVSTAETPLGGLADETGGFDVVIEATGDAQVMLDCVGLLRRGGVACLLGIDGRPQKVTGDGPTLGVDMILQNRVLFGSVNANRVDWVRAVERLERIRARWPEELDAFVGLRTSLDRYEDALAYSGVKATLQLDAG
jgi:threonine dehydrogenase-like Zn-dependent dehydrogenase